MGIQAASLAESGESYTYGIATGWGDTRKGGQISNVLLEVRVRIWSNSDCSNRYRSIDNYVTENMLCAGEPGKDTCQGDSGGPLNCPVTKFRPGQPQYKICGITSWGADCGHNGYPGVYTRVSKYIDWIDQHTGDYSNGGIYEQPCFDYSNGGTIYEQTNFDFSNEGIFYEQTYFDYSTEGTIYEQ